MALLKIEGKTVRKVAQAEVSGLAEGIAFTLDGRYLYVGNFVDGNIDILRLDGNALTKVASFALSGYPAYRPRRRRRIKPAAPAGSPPAKPCTICRSSTPCPATQPISRSV